MSLDSKLNRHVREKDKMCFFSISRKGVSKSPLEIFLTKERNSRNKLLEECLNDKHQSLALNQYVSVLLGEIRHSISE